MNPSLRAEHVTNGRAVPVSRSVNGALPQTVHEGRRHLPHDIEAERSLLAGLLTLRADRDASAAAKMISLVRDTVATAEFYREPHGRIFEAICSVDDRGDPIDPILVKAEIECRGTLARDVV